MQWLSLAVMLTQMPSYLVCGLISRKGFFLHHVVADNTQAISSETILLKTISVPSELACAQKCFANQWCLYKSYDILNGKCRLYKGISSADLAKEAKVYKKFDAKDPCETRNCGGRCKCKSLLGTEEYSCDCKVEGLSKTSQDYVHKSCSEALNSNGNVSNTYLIQPTLKLKSVKVRCEGGADGMGYAVFHHDTEAEVYVSGYNDACDNGYKKQFNYSEAMGKIIFVINNSIRCQQHTKAVCKGVSFMSYNCAWLTGRKSKKLKYWGGGPHDGIGCKCGITGSCAVPEQKCNCNAGTNTAWYKDEGNVSWKSDLPMTGIAIGDTGTSGVEVVKYTIGPLRCLV